jgi:hypothetical protein
VVAAWVVLEWRAACLPVCLAKFACLPVLSLASPRCSPRADERPRAVGGRAVQLAGGQRRR